MNLKILWSGHLLWSSLVIILLLGVACGSAAAPESPDQTNPAGDATVAETDTPVPTATPADASGPADGAMARGGSLDVGFAGFG